MFLNYLAIFFASLICIALELFLTRILNLKAWNHLVYIIIPYAILGYGIGANACLLLKDRLAKTRPHRTIGFLLIGSALFALLTALALIPLPINLQYILDIFVNVKGIGMLLVAYTILTVPFVLI